VIVGAGPAGSALAARLAGDGQSVLLVDRETFPRSKPCGECMNPGAVAALDRAGLLDAVRATDPIPLRGWSLRSAGGRGVWAPFPEGVTGYGVDRSSLDRALVREAVRRGARLEEGIHVREVVAQTEGGFAEARGTRPDGRPVRLRGRLLVGADGLRSAVAHGIDAVRRPARLRKASLSWRIRGRGPPADRGHLLLGGQWTVGLAPVPAAPGVAGAGGGTGPTPPDAVPHWNATLVVESSKGGAGLRREGWARLLDGIRRIADAAGTGWTEGPEPVDGPWASGPFDRPTRSAGAGRILLVGDAAGYYDPLTGQGMFRALRSAELAAGIVEEARDGTRSPTLALPDLGRYDRLLLRAFAPGRGLQRVIEGVLARSFLREPVFFLFERRPGPARLLIRVLGDLGLGPPTRTSEGGRDAYGG